MTPKPEKGRPPFASVAKAKLPGGSGSEPDTIVGAPTPQLIIARLKTVAKQANQLPLQEGEAGAQFLEALELVNQIRDAIRVRMREAIHEGEIEIPGWHVEERVTLYLCRDKEEGR
jgi:hypothetical protein